MKIAVCFKALADFGRLSETDWKWDQGLCVDTSFVRRMFNGFDESALELALTLSKAGEPGTSPTDLTAITVDDEKGDLFLKLLTAVGYDHAVRISCPGDVDLKFNPRALSCLISAYIRQEGHQLVILGLQGGEGDNRQTGPLVAEQLGWPCIGNVIEVARAGSSLCLKVSSRMDGATLIQTVCLPLVLTIGNTLNAPYLRVPTLKQKLLARNRPPLIVPDTQLGLDPDWRRTDKTLLGLQRSPKTRSCLFLEEGPPRIQAQQLYEHHLKQRLAP